MYRIKRLQTLGIEEIAPLIRDALLVSPPVNMLPTNAAIYGVFVELVTGKAQAWVLYNQLDRQAEVCGIAVTAVLTDPIAKVRVLHAYTIWASRAVEQDAVDVMVVNLQKYAKVNKCTKITFITDNNNAVASLTAAGFDKSSYLSMEV